MTNLTDLAEFTSSELAPFLPEECQANPEVYGAELAFWLARALVARGVVTSYPESEDWGWYLDHRTDDGSEFAVHCGNVGGSRSRWFLQLRRFGRKSFGRDKPPFAEAARLVDGIRRCLEEDPAITDVRWRYADPDAE